MEREFQLYEAARLGNAKRVSSLLKNHLGLNVNSKNEKENNWAPLHIACKLGHSQVVSVLLAHPYIDVNTKTLGGRSAFFMACMVGSLPCAELLLGDQRILYLNDSDNEGRTPLWVAASRGHLAIVKLWIVSGRELYLGRVGNQHNDSIAEARRKGRTEMVELLERLKRDSGLTKHELRLQSGYYDERAAAVFAILVFVCDDLLRISDGFPGASSSATGELAGEAAATARFIRIASQLPMELQMVLAYRVAGSLRNCIVADCSESAFRNLAQKFPKPRGGVLQKLLGKMIPGS